MLEIARQNRASLYNLAAGPPSPLVPRELRFTVTERMGPEGEILPLDDEPEAAVSAVEEAEVEAVAVCLLLRVRAPQHEERVGKALREALPHVHVSLSSEVLPEFREYERFSTTAADAYLAPRLAAYLKNLAGKAEESGPPAPDHAVLGRGGGIDDAIDAAGCVPRVLRGGVVGAAYVGALGGYQDLLTRHGRDEHRRRPHHRRRGADDDGDGGCKCLSNFPWWTCTRERRRRLHRLGRRGRALLSRPPLGRRGASGRLRHGRRGARRDGRQPLSGVPARRGRARRRGSAATRPR